MAGRTIHLEESTASTVGVFKLLLFFKGFFSPYKLSVVITSILAFFVIGTELLLPQLLKTALDRYITVSARKVLLSDAHGKNAGLAERYRTVLIPSGNEKDFFILPDDLKAIGEKELRLLEAEGILSPEKFYVAKASPEKEALLQKHPASLCRAGENLFISYANLAKLSADDILVLRSEDLRGITKITFLFLALLVGNFLFNFTQIYLVEYTSQKLMHDVRVHIFSHLQSRSHCFFTKNPVGRLVTRVTNDVQNLHEMFSALFASVFKDVFLILGIMAALFFINWQLSLVCFSVLPVLIACATLFSVTSQNAFREVRIKIASLNSKVQENITGINVVKAFCREKINVLRFRKLNQENYAANMKQTIVFAIFTPFVDLTRVSAIALIIWYGGGRAVSEAITLGTLVVFLYYMRMFFTPIQDIAEKYNIIQSAFASLERIYLLLHDHSTIAEPLKPVRAENLRGDIEFRNVAFSYNENEPVLKDISFSVKSGETVAIAGLTGAGKSTIINLLERFYDVNHGSICINGIDIRQMDTDFLRGQIGLVMQDVFLFAGTIKSNITLGSTLFSDEQISQAIKIANADSFIQRLPAGINEEVHEGGKTLSAGQRQLLSFARAVLINPAILVLDEATSSIDPVTEELIQDAMEKLLHGRTAIIIAHRFSTIRKADKIIVLHKGRIHEQGTHDELMAKAGLYKQLYDVQYIK